MMGRRQLEKKKAVKKILTTTWCDKKNASSGYSLSAFRFRQGFDGDSCAVTFLVFKYGGSSILVCCSKKDGSKMAMIGWEVVSIAGGWLFGGPELDRKKRKSKMGIANVNI